MGSPKQLEKRRRRAVALLAKGMGLREVARRVHASVASVHRWHEAWRKRGQAGLNSKTASGRPPKLASAERQRLLRRLALGAVAHGFPNELWTLKRIASVVAREFDTEYHPSHLWKVLQSSGWSCQVPERRALQRDEKAIAHWKRHKWPAIKKTAKTWGPSRLRR